MIYQSFPANSSPLLDSNGKITPIWHQFFQTLWERTGTASGATPVATLPTQAVPLSQIESLIATSLTQANSVAFQDAANAQYAALTGAINYINKIIKGMESYPFSIFCGNASYQYASGHTIFQGGKANSTYVGISPIEGGSAWGEIPDFLGLLLTAVANNVSRIFCGNASYIYNKNSGIIVGGNAQSLYGYFDQILGGCA